MALAKYDSSFAYDQVLKRGIAGQVAKVVDAETGIPVEGIQDLEGRTIPALVSNSQGYLPPFQVENGPSVVQIQVGPVSYILIDYLLVGDSATAAQDAAVAAQQAASLVEAPADEVVATLVQGDTLTQTAGDARWVTNEGADNTVSALLASNGSATQSAGDSRYMRTIMQPTAPPVTLGAMWFDTTTGKMHYPVSRGEDPRTNKCTNPALSETSGLVTNPRAANINAATFNLRYRALDTGMPGQNWADRLPYVAEAVTAMGASIIGCQEVQDASRSTSQLKELATTLGEDWVNADGAQNNGILYRSDLYEILTDVVTTEINKIYLQSGAQRTISWATFRHKESARRFIFAVTHFQAGTGATVTLARAESARIVGEMLTNLRSQYPDRPPLILTADFNNGEYDADKPYGILETYGLANTRSSATSVGNSTLNSFNDFDATMTGKQGGYWIDGVLATSDLTVGAAGAYVKYASGSSLPLATPIPSDHNPVHCELSVEQIPGVRLQGAAAAVSTGGRASAYVGLIPETGRIATCVDPLTSSGTATSVYPAGQAGGMARLGMEASKTYTVSATLTILEAQTGTLDTHARKIMIGANSSFTFAQSAQAPNAPGTYRLSVTFTYTPTVTDGHVRLMNGSRNEAVYWSDLVVEEGETDGSYFDGDSTGCYWQGTPRQSESVYSGPSWVPVGG